MLPSVYLSKTVVLNTQFPTKQAETFNQICLICGFCVELNGSFCGNNLPGGPDSVLTFNFVNHQRCACIILLRMNAEPGFTVSSKLTENTHLAKDFLMGFFFATHLNRIILPSQFV